MENVCMSSEDNEYFVSLYLKPHNSSNCDGPHVAHLVYQVTDCDALLSLLLVGLHTQGWCNAWLGHHFI